MGQPVMNGAVYYHNGVPYTYQNGVAMFTGAPATAEQAASLAAVQAAQAVAQVNLKSRFVSKLNTVFLSLETRVKLQGFACCYD